MIEREKKMNLEQIKTTIKQPEYDFLRTDPHLGKNIILLGLGGSHAYGTEKPDGSSDLDIRGIALNSKTDILLKRDFEQVIEKETDTTIYSFDKIVDLLLNMNPNICEILGNKPEYYLYISPIGQEFLNNKDLFISKRCVNSFKGYANQQMYKLKQATAGMKNQSELEEHILNTMNNMMNNFGNRYTPFPLDNINLYIDKSNRDDYNTEIFMDINLTHYPLRDWRGMWAEMNSTVKSYSKIGKRNKHAIEKNKLGKHMCHIARLHYMCLDILKGNGIITYREKEHDLLMDLRNDKWLDENKMPLPKFFTLFDELMNEVDYVEKYSNIPDEPDYEKIYKFVASVNERIVRGEI